MRAIAIIEEHEVMSHLRIARIVQCRELPELVEGGGFAVLREDSPRIGTYIVIEFELDDQFCRVAKDSP